MNEIELQRKQKREVISRLIRIETRLARLEEHAGINTHIRLDDRVLQRQSSVPIQIDTKRLARIETRICTLLEANNLEVNSNAR